MVTAIEGQCQYEGCDQPATHIACGRVSYVEGFPQHPEPACYCKAHADVVSDERYPEYTAACPNCGCLFGNG